MVRASCSSLKPHKSSSDPPPRTSKIKSMCTLLLGAELTSGAESACAYWYRFNSALTNSAGAAAPCTKAGASTTGMCGTRRCSAATTSCKAAAPRDVTTPMPRGIGGSGRLRAGSNKPSASSCALSRKNCSNKAPCPATPMLSTISCKSPRGSYTPRRPRTSTSPPSRGEKSSKLAARRNMAQRIWPCPSLRLK